LKVKNPKGYHLYEQVIKKIIKLPSTATMTALGKLASGQTPSAAPTFTSYSTSNDICKCNCKTGCCGETPTGTAAKFGTKPTGLTDKTNVKCGPSASYLISTAFIMLFSSLLFQ